MRKKFVLLQIIQPLLDGLYMTLAWIFNIDKDVIPINNNKNVKFFKQDFFDKIPKFYQCIK